MSKVMVRCSITIDGRLFSMYAMADKEDKTGIDDLKEMLYMSLMESIEHEIPDIAEKNTEYDDINAYTFNVDEI